ncbi:FmdB family zinc ribbon protein [Leifsonia sp. 21MFCrub1.1]|uniref:FmdB family zinc ribbon protein n=1 Tax=Leifsonia sp. 21MFCrub1.1 TaxID=1798223 RepID=UPI000892929A|nr:FmdB family zinc ribbon protein [Leifsonia sp. 21MFCrub1.1]SEB09310.1 putative regulatory protein, FmdB family [Leifsonia sp. 21MFCrub1.1]
MILYDYQCVNSHRFEAAVRSMADASPNCPTCGAETAKRPSRVQLGGRASTGPSREQMPKSWNAVRGGDKETVRRWHDLAAKREKLEERHPELAGNRRPVLAHEGIFREKPLRAGDDIAKSVSEAVVTSKEKEK